MRVRVACGVLMAVFGLGMLAPVLVGPAVGQENRPTQEQPDPGQKIERPARDENWAYNWVARPLLAIMVLFIVALAAGYGIRWIGIGRRTT